jgi:hypothetical protein
VRKYTKNVVETSFTYGHIGLDMKLLLKLIQEAEDIRDAYHNRVRIIAAHRLRAWSCHY